VRLTLTLRYGNAENLKGYETAAGFLPELMQLGTKKLTEQQLRDELDRLKATLGSGGGGGRRGGGRRGGGGGGMGVAGAASFSVQARRETLPAVLELLRQVLREPALPAERFDVLKRERLAGLEQMQSEPAMLGPRRLQRELNPYAKEDVRYVPTVAESIERLRGTKYEQVVTLYREFLGSQAGELTIIGDFDPDACLTILRATLAGWKAAQPYARIPMPLVAAPAGGEHRIQTPDKANATYAAGLVFALRDDDPDYAAVLMGNYLFGGGSLSSRLATRVRQQEGLSYSVGSSLSVSAFDRRASLGASAICNPQNVSRLQQCVREEVDRLLKEGVTAQELEQGRDGYLKSLQVSRSNDAMLAGTLAGLRHEGRTMAWQAELERQIRALTPEQIQAALRRHVDPARLVTVVAGDFEAKPGPSVAE
jgi:zinc protease